MSQYVNPFGELPFWDKRESNPASNAIDYSRSVEDPGLDKTNLPPRLSGTIESLQRQLKAPIPTVFGVVIAALGSLFSQRFVVEGLRTAPIPLSVYVLVASDTGEGKSSVTSGVLEPIREYEADLIEKEQERGVAEQSDVILNRAKSRSLNKLMLSAIADNDDKKAREFAEQIAQIKTSYNQHKSAVQMLLSDCTMPGLKRALSHNPFSVLIANSEASKFLAHLIDNAETYCAAWSGEALKIYQGKITIETPDPKLSMVLLTQTKFAEGILEDEHDFRVTGLAARFLIFQPLSMRGRKHFFQNDFSGTQNMLPQWREFLLDQCERNYIYAAAAVPRTIIKLTDESRSFLMAVEAEVEQFTAPGQRYSKIKDMAFRMVEQICRLATIFQLYEEPLSEALSINFVRYAYGFMISYLDNIACLISGPKGSDYAKANKILRFLSGSSMLVNIILENSYYPVSAMKLSDFQRNAPIRGKRNSESALHLLMTEGRIQYINHTYHNGIRLTTATFIVINNFCPIETPQFPNSAIHNYSF
ncbi:DUF3987 domain-containing protein [Acidithiobacillus ferriphilus]|uniref:DUF3987 domain-containing protein n=1 Tax=Acidithiobacillus ferriphilus TaxID=1689834 RepID=UPI00390CAB8A